MKLNFKKLSEEATSKLELPFTLEEIKEGVWNYDESKATGLDGFNMCFFKGCWQLVREDLFNMMIEFFTGKLKKSINSLKIRMIFQILDRSVYKMVARCCPEESEKLWGIL